MSEKKKIKKIVLLIVCIFVLSVALYWVVTGYVLPSRQYQRAMMFYQEGDYRQAREHFHAVGDFKDSSHMMDESTYQLAIELRNNQQYEYATNLLKSIIEYKDAKEVLLTFPPQYLYRSMQQVQFGRWEQNGNVSNGAEPLVWCVLDYEEDKLTLISRDILTYTEEYEESWTWLYDFSQQAFTEAEKRALQEWVNTIDDHVFNTYARLPEYKELEAIDLVDDSWISSPTPAARKIYDDFSFAYYGKNLSISSKKTAYRRWRLEHPHYDVGADGRKTSGFSVASGIRPMIIIRLSEAQDHLVYLFDYNKL